MPLVPLFLWLWRLCRCHSSQMEVAIVTFVDLIHYISVLYLYIFVSPFFYFWPCQRFINVSPFVSVISFVLNLWIFFDEFYCFLILFGNFMALNRLLYIVSIERHCDFCEIDCFTKILKILNWSNRVNSDRLFMSCSGGVTAVIRSVCVLFIVYTAFRSLLLPYFLR